MTNSSLPRRFLTVVLLGASISTAAACGGADPTDKSADGARAAYLDLATLIKDGKAKEACDKYVTKEAQQQLEALGSCALILKSLSSKDREELNLDEVESAKVKVEGDTATFTGPKGDKGELTYVDDSWKISID